MLREQVTGPGLRGLGGGREKLRTSGQQGGGDSGLGQNMALAKEQGQGMSSALQKMLGELWHRQWLAMS